MHCLAKGGIEYCLGDTVRIGRHYENIHVVKSFLRLRQYSVLSSIHCGLPDIDGIFTWCVHQSDVQRIQSVSGNAEVLVADWIIFTECDYGSAGEHIQYCLIGPSDSADTEWLFTPCRSSNKKRMVLSGLADRAFSECIGRSD